MLVKVIFDKKAVMTGLRTGWGLSFLIEGGILFDTGEKGAWLLENMAALGVNANMVTSAVISHDHWDHTGGLWDLLNLRKGLRVFACPGFSDDFKRKVSAAGGILDESRSFRQITGNIFLTGEIGADYKGGYLAEQAVALKTASGVTLITGCAHPGVLKMAEAVRNSFPSERLDAVLGGFHLMESDSRSIEFQAEKLKVRGVRKAGPTHCSGELAETVFKKHFTDNFLPLGAGMEFEV